MSVVASDGRFHDLEWHDASFAAHASRGRLDRVALRGNLLGGRVELEGQVPLRSGAEPGLVAGLTGGMVLLKLGVLALLARVFRLGLDQALLFAFALPQVGEFAFVLFSFANQEGVLAPAITETSGSPAASVIRLGFVE